ncbi:sigma-70 family RNA polymerase sigma factor [Nocardioides sp. CER19]|uniref:sigma-70 family RNA polymerase sigma factor n=1 Tax=Nocardioides sp. CER19 TaxID=3038538 RepID=UPI002449FF51|nr:sigma-70 family RNA polymerase sigma factor [Nocardioides sp. CER19]MDH2415529.1 sigma-70 family RNA polymerase sigma factor [Nocardioides sp. CER19]
MAATARSTLPTATAPAGHQDMPRPRRGLPDGDAGVTRAERADTTEGLLALADRTDDELVRQRLLDEVILLNRGVADAVASRYRRRGVPIEDLQQAAYEGLVKAVNRWDSSHGKPLLTYAVPTIRGELQRHFRDHGWTVRPPRRVQELQWQVSGCIAELTQALGREPSDTEVQEQLGITDTEYADAMTAFGCFQPTSLDQPVGPEAAATLGDLIPDQATEEAGTDQLAAADARATLGPAVRSLPSRDRRILYLRFFEEQTQEQIGEELGVTQMQVSRLLARILRDLRGAIT